MVSDTSNLSGKSSLSQTKLADLPGVSAQDAEQVELQPGQLLVSRYEIKELIGQGGMGAVYRAFDNNRSEDIAIKVLLPSLTKNERALERFLNEARVSSNLSHPKIINVYDVQNDGNLYFLTMELLEGQDLRQVMDNQKTVGRPFEVDDVKEYIAAISEALSCAHETTVHRDIKPENVWVCSDGKLKLMDFGIAQLQSSSQRTQTGAAMGTAYYMAPEQLKGLSNIDGRADQYAVAVLAYELLTGEVPAGAIEPIGELRKDLPKGMANAIMQGLSPRAENRFADMSEFNAAIQSGKKANSPRSARSISENTQGVSNNVMKIGVAVFVLLLVIIGMTQDISRLLPMSKAEIAKQKAEAAQFLGEITTIKQRLANGRRTLDSDVRDAVRNGSRELTAVRDWQTLTEERIFAGNHLPSLEGQLAMAESLLRENSFDEAKVNLSSVRDGYNVLWDNFVAAGKLYALKQDAQAASERWFTLKSKYKLDSPSEAARAKSAEEQANNQQLAGDFLAANDSWLEAKSLWVAATKDPDLVEVMVETDSRREAKVRLAEAAKVAVSSSYNALLSYFSWAGKNPWEEKNESYVEVYNTYSRKSELRAMTVSLTPENGSLCVLNINALSHRKIYKKPAGERSETHVQNYRYIGLVDFRSRATTVSADDDVVISVGKDSIVEEFEYKTDTSSPDSNSSNYVNAMHFMVIKHDGELKQKTARHFRFDKLSDLLLTHQGNCRAAI